MIEIIPAIMPKNFSDLEEGVKKVKKYVSLVQVDIMDGVFVEGKTWPYTERVEEFNSICNKEKSLPDANVLDYEVDLMVSEPEQVVESWVCAGVSRIIIHLESTESMDEIIACIKSHAEHTSDKNFKEVSLGVAINTTTSVELVEPFVKDISFVQCMGIAEIGKQGQSFDERVYEQLRSLRKKYPDLVLSVDGAVHFDNAKDLAEAGADRLVSGSEIFGDSSVEVSKKIERFHDIVRAV